jgi:tetratricopeptide (TPR) repeat protein
MSQLICSHSRIPVLLLLAIALTGCSLISPHNEAYFLKRGREFLAAKDYPRALLEFAPRDAEPHYQAGLVYLYSGDYRAAIGSFRLCLDFNPGHLGAQLKTAELMTSSAKPETLSKAAAQLREVLALSPQNTGATDALALTE